MRLLLDSHTLIWSQDDTGQLSAAANAALSNPGNDRLISAATVWEIAIKVGKGRLPLSKSFRVGMETAIADLGLTLTFRASPAHLKAAARGHGGATTPETTLEKILALLLTDPSMTRREMAKRIGITLEGIRYHLTKLKAARRIRHAGSTKAGYWEILV